MKRIKRVKQQITGNILLRRYISKHVGLQLARKNALLENLFIGQTRI